MQVEGMLMPQQENILVPVETMKSGSNAQAYVTTARNSDLDHFVGRESVHRPFRKEIGCCRVTTEDLEKHRDARRDEGDAT